MARCYEFGVLVGEGCEHAMVVSGEGGRCECSTCGAACTGRFSACAAILEKAGYVPVTAPAWAVAVGERPQPPAPPERPDPPLVPAVDPTHELHGVRAHGGSDDVTELVERVAKQLAEHDVDLATRIDALGEHAVELGNRVDALAEQLAALQRQNVQQAAALHKAIIELAELMKKLDEGRSAPPSLFGFPRRPL